MYGVPENLNVTQFHGAELIQICHGQHQTLFNFDAGQSIAVEGKWHLVGPDGEIIDGSERDRKREGSRTENLLGRTVCGSKVLAPVSFELELDNGMTLRIFDDSTEYESFSIQPGDVFV